MHVKQYSSLGQAIFDHLGNSGRKDPDTMFTRKKDPDPKPLFLRKIHFRQRFRKAPFWGPSVFKKLRIRADTCDRFYVLSFATKMVPSQTGAPRLLRFARAASRESRPISTS